MNKNEVWLTGAKLITNNRAIKEILEFLYGASRQLNSTSFIHSLHTKKR